MHVAGTWSGDMAIYWNIPQPRILAKLLVYYGLWFLGDRVLPDKN